ncbi:MAG: polysaccharide biosynthesis tyrosine autokinase [Verrucomicrobiota bacterium]|nr:polysaccharide biosynthesis tyrosine autokinase [Verrucomicrobiota bacterium]
MDYWRIIRIRKTVILAVFLLVVITTTAVTFILPETYMSSTRIQVEKDTSNIATLLQMPQASGYDPYFVNTEFEKIKSTKVLNKVIEDLGLNEVWSKRYGTEGKLKTHESYQLLKKQIDVQQARNTSLIDIRAYSEDKKEAAAIANRIAQVYRETRMEKQLEFSRTGIEALKKEFDTQSEKVKSAQEEVDKLRKELKISDVGDAYLQTTVESETVRNMERDRIRAHQDFVTLNTLYEQLVALNPATLRQAIPTAYPDPALDRLLTDYAKTEQQYTIAKNDYGQEHPEVIRLLSLLSNINSQIEGRLDGIMKGLSAQVTARKATLDMLTESVENAKKEDTEMTAKYRPYFIAKRDLETQQRIRESIHLRILQETVDQKIPKSGAVEIVIPAEEPTKPVRPNIGMNITLGVLVGLIMGFGLAFFIEYLDTSVKTIDDVERTLGSPVLGVIPQNVGSLIDEGPDSPHAEAYRVLRTNLLFSRKDSTWNTITVVSGGAGEGKSTTIFNLATIFAQNGATVLLVDSDLRRPSLHKILNVTNSIGLTNFLLKQNTLEEVVQVSPIPGLSFLPSGKLPSSSLGILNSNQMKEFIRQAKERFDFVFFDSPPIMGVSDASVLASEVDMALLVIQYRKYPQVMTIRAKQMVEKVGGNLMGVVLNNINISQDSYYYYYSGYYYDYYSKHDDDESGSPAKNGKSKETKVASAERGGVDLKQKY